MTTFPRPGGCSCGAIRYELTEDPITVYVCHCSDCQTATGSAFAMSMIVRKQAIVITQGEPTTLALILPPSRLPRPASTSSGRSARNAARAYG